MKEVTKVVKGALVVAGPLMVWTIEPIYGVMFAGTEIVAYVGYVVWAKWREDTGEFVEAERYDGPNK